MHRLRDLDRRQRLLAAGLVALLLVPFGASLGRAIHQAWLPSGDDALIGLRSLDVFSRHLPLVGQPSTSHLYGDKISTAHPGPIEFYWLAVPVRLFGAAVGMIVGIGLANLAGVLVAAWVVFRRCGATVGAWSLVLLGGVLWSEGTAVLTDPISSNAGGIPMLALAALAWAVADGDLRLLPLAALFGSWVAQQHLAIVAPAASLVALAVVGATVAVTVPWWRRRRARSTEAPPDDAPDAEPRDAPEAEPAGPRVWPWLLGAVAVAFICWLPVLWQQLTGHPGNITAVLDYAGSSDTAKLGLASGVRQAVRALGWPPLLVRSNLGGEDFFGAPLHPAEVVLGAVGYLVLVASVVTMWRRRRPIALLAGSALVLAIGGIYNGSTIPDSIESFRINFYRWAFVVAWLSWIVFGWLLALGASALIGRQDRTATVAVAPAALRRAAPVAAVLALLVPAVASAAVAGHDDQRRDQAGFRIMRRAADAAVAAADGKRRVTLVLRGQSAVLASGPALTMALSAHGHDVVLPAVEPRFYGSQRVLRAGDDPGDLILELVTGRGSVPPGPGHVILHDDLNSLLNQAMAPLVAQARSAPVEVAPDGDRLLRQHWKTDGERTYIRTILAKIAVTPEAVLSDPKLLAVIGDGYFSSPRFDRDGLASVRAHLPARTVNNDDVFEVRVLTRAQLAEEVPAWAKD
ncbi:MAG: hypothetical protein JWM89_2111 [Acidimicrobiales bacterium]|nr:hypothetical protein [Acidimicrobiales bacterium]